MRDKHDVTPEKIWGEYESGRRFKASLGEQGLYEQNRRNERFYVGDQWHGAKCGDERPLVRHNVIRRIGEYKMAVVGSAPLTVRYSIEGLPCSDTISKAATEQRKKLTKAIESGGEIPTEAVPNIVADTMAMDILSNHFDSMSERTKFDAKMMRVLKDAYIAGTGILHAYWDADIGTGLFADEDQSTAIRGDVQIECLDVENVYFGDPNTVEVQEQPYILIVQRKSVRDIRALAEKHGVGEAERRVIHPDRETTYMAGERSEEPSDSKKATLITRLWKVHEKDGTVTVKGMQVCKGVVIRKEWDLGIRLYPLAVMQWEERKGCIYGDSEITYLIPNQIAINRMITASVWAVMMLGIPMTIVNGDVVDEPVTNDPGQVLRVFGSAEDVASAVRYVNPPNFSPQFDQNIQSLIGNTLSQSGANDAALGNMRPDNTSAIVAVREAATMPMQMVQNRYFSFVEDVARIEAEFSVMKYGKRPLKVANSDGVFYLPFDSDRYRERMLSAKVDVGTAGVYAEQEQIATLNNLRKAGIITDMQYLERLPKGKIPRQKELIEEKREQERAQQDTTDPDAKSGDPIEEILAQLPDEYREQLEQLPREQQEAILAKVMSA